MTDWVTELCRHVGITSQYRGYEGQTIDVARETQVAVLTALGLDVASQADAKAVLSGMQAEVARRPLPQEIIVTAGQDAECPIAWPVEWSLHAEGTGQTLASGRGVHSIALPALPLGIHELRLAVGSGEFTTWVLARPSRAFSLSDRIETPRVWGVLTALYGLTDGHAVSLGTYDLLGKYAAAMAAHGADYIGINPIHAMGKARPDDIISPYSPSHRGFLNTWHTEGSGPATSDLIDYSSALRDGDAALAADYEAFRQRPDGSCQKRALADFTAAAGAPLRDFAVFEALSAHFGPDWRTWPAPYHDPSGPEVADFAQSREAAISQTVFAQWRAEAQLGEAQEHATEAGMRIGLYLDLAVGPRLGGAETWSRDTALVTSATLGAPPDPLGPLGQSWGLAPYSPVRLRETGYAEFARLLRAVMRNAGMIRIDHALGLMRSFWIPEDGPEGTYVAYPLDALLAVVTIESVRNQTIVVGEDLGLVPAGLRDRLAASGIYGLDVMQYMRTETGGFVEPGDMRVKAVCAFATHDTPTIAGFFSAQDAIVRAGFGGVSSTTLSDIKADRQTAAETLETSQPVEEIHARLARSRSEMVAIQLDDIARRKDQQNLPGTVDEYPNWRLRAPFALQDVATSGAFVRIAKEMAAQGRTNKQGMEKDNGLQDCSHLAP